MKPVIRQLANGMTVLVWPMHGVKTCAASLSFRAGARHEKCAGAAHLMEHMVFKGTAKRSAKKIVEDIENAGGYINAATSHEMTFYQTRMPSAELALGLDVIADMVLHPALAENDLAHERKVVMQEISEAKDAPAEAAGDLLMLAAFAGQKLGGNILGTPESLAGISRENLRAYAQTHYHAGNAMLAAAGDVKPETFFRQAETLFAPLARRQKSASEKSRFTGGEKREKRDIGQAHIMLAFPAPPRGTPDSITAAIFADILGGGMASRLFQKVREEMGLCYSISAFTQAFSDTGLLGVYAAASPDDVPSLIPAVASVFQDLCQKPSAEEIRRAKAQYKTALLLTLESSAARASYIASQYHTYQRIPPIEEKIRIMEKVDAAGLQTFAAHWLKQKPVALAAIGAISRLEKYDKLAARFT